MDDARNGKGDEAAMKRLLLVLCVVCVGCADVPERSMAVENELQQRAEIIDTLQAVCQRMEVRIDRLVADSARCADKEARR